MNIAIVVIGLSLTVAGTYLAWHSKGAGIWATFAFGFLLVLVGGPVSSRLGSFSVTGTGVEVAFNAASVPSAEKGAISENVQAALLSLTPQVKGAASQVRAVLGSASRSFQRELLDYISAAGFTPIQPTGAELLRPGTVIRLEQGRPIAWAFSSEAFTGLQVTESSVAIPRVNSREKSAEGETEISFKCEQGSKISEASLYALSSSAGRSVVRAIQESRDLRVVQSIMVCKGFRISARIQSEQGEEEDNLSYGEKANVVLGLRLATLTAKKTDQ